MAPCVAPEIAAAPCLCAAAARVSEDGPAEELCVVLLLCMH